MRLIYRYIFVNAFLPFLYLFVSFNLLFIIADLLENGIDFYKSQLSFLTFIDYYILKLPSYSIIIIPICLLLSTIFSLNNLSKNGEISALKSSGISIQKISIPFLIIGILFGFVILSLEHFYPKNEYYAEQFKKSKLGHVEEIKKEIDYVNIDLNHYWYIQKFNTSTEVIEGITIRKRREDGSDIEKINAEKGYWVDNKWWFQNISIQKFNENSNLIGPPIRLQVKEMNEITETPKDFLVEKNPNHLNLIELINITSLKNKVYNNNDYLIALHQKLSKPFLCLICILIGFPISMQIPRKNSYMKFIISLALFFSYYGLWFLMEYLSRTSVIQAPIAAWSTTIIFMIIGIYFLQRSN